MVQGTTTHFWPSYFLEPEFTGVAIHELSKKIDSGPLVHQVSGDLVLGDGIHELSSRTIKKSIDECIILLKNIISKKKIIVQFNKLKRVNFLLMMTGMSDT